MLVKALVVGGLEVNAYVIYDKKGGECAVVDPGADFEKIHAYISENGLTVKYILLTHGHYDHIGAVAELKQATGAPVCIAAEDAPALQNGALSLAKYSGIDIKPSQADILLKDGDIIEVAGERFHVMATPGHSRGSVCFITDSVMFSGDTVFYNSVGRSDFPGSSVRDLTHSLKLIAQIQGDRTIYPGHGPSTTLDGEKRSNYFLSRMLI